MRNSAPRIFIGFKEIAGYYSNLQKGFEKLGLQADFFCLAANRLEHRFRVPPNRLMRLMVKIERAGRHRGRGPGRALLSLLRELVRFFLGLQLFFFVMPGYDIFIFGANSTLCHFLEMPFLRLAGKKIICVFNGSDTRPPYINRKQVTDPAAFNLFTCARRTRKKKRILARTEKYADVIVNYPPTSHFLKRPFVNILSLGIPIDIADPGKPRPPEKDGPVRLLHAPTHRKGKGTEQITRAIENLRRRGVPLELRLVSGVPHRVVLDELARCDFVVDQLYSDTPMAGLATEAAFLGKPSVVGGYYTQQLKIDLPAAQIPPTLYCRPEEIETAILKLVEDEPFRLALGLKARAYVRENWAPEKVAEKYLALARGDFPSAWLYNPSKNRYLHGFGFSEAEVKTVLARLIAGRGVGALGLSDKPGLEKAFADFAAGGAARG